MNRRTRRSTRRKSHQNAMYHVVVRNKRTGHMTRMTSSPVTYREGRTILSKITDYELRRRLEEWRHKGLKPA